MGGMRRLRLVLALLGLVALGMVPAVPAQAGNWAVTLLDPVPSTFEAGQSYTVGYWVLQHGAYPNQGDLGRTGLRLVGPDKQELIFEGVGLREQAHYAAAIALPGDGTWRVFALQGRFAEHEVGTLTVPGGLSIKKPEMEVNVGGNDGEAIWGAVHPPGYGGPEGHAARIAPAAPGGANQANQQPVEQEVRNAAEMPQPRSPVLMGLLALAAVVVLVGAGLLVRRRVRG